MSAGMAAFVLLLLLGTQVLDWAWLVLVPAAAFGAGVYRIIRRLPSAYAVAQLVDNRLKLADSLSTAYFFDGSPRHYSEDTCAAQRAQAERLCEQVSLRQAVPFTVPKGVYAMLALFATASSLFALRYGLERRLDLQRPMLAILQQAMGFDQQRQLAEEKKKKDSPKRNKLDELATLSVPAGDQQAGRLNSQQDGAVDSSGKPEDAAALKKGREQAQKMSAGENGEGDESEMGEDGAEGFSTGNESGSEGKQAPAMGKQEGQSGKQSAQSSNSSLMSKFKDAMQNLLSRMKPSSSGSSTQGQQQSAQNQAGKQNSSQSGSRSEAGRQGRQQSGQEGDAQEGQSGQDAQTTQSAQAQGQGQNGEQQDSNQPGSGIGRQDGSKDVKAAEQLAAMGKISELIGKRSASVSGEVTVEVQSNSQQIQTPYAQRGARHGETTAEISRDEVPVSLQSYVEHYFEQVRRQPPPAASKKD